ncbi:hypothetical protein [Amycolatopsis sp. NPDC051102]|uniref:hypothetical protein n=1 Tax=Amycolatopsis sp. NPDC051102 TaxID=3155163 RepID=UPI00343AC40B
MDETKAEVAETPYKRPTMQEFVEWVMEEPPAVGNLAELLDLAAVGIVKHAWRNSPLEDVHADPSSPLTDGEMMRTNAATTRLVRESLQDFFHAIFDVDVPPAGTSGTSSESSLGDGELHLDECDFLDEFSDADLLADSMLGPLYTAMTRRVLPGGYTVREAASELFEELDDHIAANLDYLADVTEQHGLRAALYLKAKAAHYERWWLGQDWLELVDALDVVLADPKHDHWQVRGYPDPDGRPGRCGNLEQLKAVLRQGPDRLTAAEAEWCVEDVGIGFVLHRVRSDAADRR